MSTQARAPHRVVIVGAGFGGVFATKALKRADVEVTLIDRNTHHLFQPLLYQVATGILSEGEVAPPTRDILRRQKNARVILGESSTSTSRRAPSPRRSWGPGPSCRTTRCSSRRRRSVLLLQ